MTEFRPVDFAPTVEPRVAVKTFARRVGVVVGFGIAAYLIYISIADPDTIISFFERIFTY